MDLADQTLVEDLSRDADTSVIQEVAVSGLPTFEDSPLSVLDSTPLTLVSFFPFFFLLPRFFFWEVG